MVLVAGKMVLFTVEEAKRGVGPCEDLHSLVLSAATDVSTWCLVRVHGGREAGQDLRFRTPSPERVPLDSADLSRLLNLNFLCIFSNSSGIKAFTELLQMRCIRTPCRCFSSDFVKCRQPVRPSLNLVQIFQK